MGIFEKKQSTHRFPARFLKKELFSSLRHGTVRTFTFVDACLEFITKKAVGIYDTYNPYAAGG